MVSKRKIARTARTVLNGCAVISLLFLYLFSSSNLESLHGLIHEHEATVLPKYGTDNDPCDIRLHYQNRAGGCDHDAHFVKEDKCPLCHVQLCNPQVAEISAISLQVAFSIVFSFDSFERYKEGINFQSPGRAPPIS